MGRFKFFNRKPSEVISDYQKNRIKAMNVISELDLEKKVTQKSDYELKAIALELLFLGSIEIRLIARSDRFSKGFSKLSILDISDGMHNLPQLIGYLENDKVDPAYFRASLELEINKCIFALIMNFMMQNEKEKHFSRLHLNDFLNKYMSINVNLKDIVQ
ncbi:hypothetical protein ABD91_26210 [Lysinibacillus sphaericus]|uniref:hypothetical protein n=1 Tax=Lysinibacillus sphaericus TaxID=1421 RepID=UPI0018CF81DB|nr:hypothetical protein [Lysinibacillus sphaericus]MBG9694226.1 hypothetical protein [Lysinibacillus sphaericus]